MYGTKKKGNRFVNLYFKPEKNPSAIYFFLPSLCVWEMKQFFAEQHILFLMLISIFFMLAKDHWILFPNIWTLTLAVATARSCHRVKGTGRQSPGKQPVEQMAN